VYQHYIVRYVAQTCEATICIRNHERFPSVTSQINAHLDFVHFTAILLCLRSEADTVGHINHYCCLLIYSLRSSLLHFSSSAQTHIQAQRDIVLGLVLACSIRIRYEPFIQFLALRIGVLVNNPAQTTINAGPIFTQCSAIIIVLYCLRTVLIFLREYRQLFIFFLKKNISRLMAL